MITKNGDLENDVVKNRIIKYLYEKVKNPISSLEITKNEQVNVINKTYHLVPELGGVRSWIIIFHHRDQYYAVNFPKVSDSYRKRKDWHIYPINVPIHKSYFLGTIMEGIYTRSARSLNRYLIIDEIYFCKGRDLRATSFTERMKHIHEFVDNGIKKNSELNIYPVLSYPVNNNGMLKIYEDMKSNPAIKKIQFVPPDMKRKRLFYVVVKADLINDIIRTAKLIMVNTNKKDVYHLYQKNNNKVGLAYIPTIELSENIIEWFNKAKKILVKCQYDNQKQKWIPVEFIKKVE